MLLEGLELIYHSSVQEINSDFFCFLKKTCEVTSLLVTSSSFWTNMLVLPPQVSRAVFIFQAFRFWLHPSFVPFQRKYVEEKQHFDIIQPSTLYVWKLQIWWTCNTFCHSCSIAIHNLPNIFGRLVKLNGVTEGNEMKRFQYEIWLRTQKEEECKDENQCCEMLPRSARWTLYGWRKAFSVAVARLLQRNGFSMVWSCQLHLNDDC